jgi:hypothetical protein
MDLVLWGVFFSKSQQNEFCGAYFSAAELCAAKPPLDGCRWVGKWGNKNRSSSRLQWFTGDSARCSSAYRCDTCVSSPPCNAEMRCIQTCRTLQSVLRALCNEIQRRTIGSFSAVRRKCSAFCAVLRGVVCWNSVCKALWRAAQAPQSAVPQCVEKFRDQHLPARTRLRDGFGVVRGVFSISQQNEFCGTHFGAAESCAAKPQLDGCRWVGKWEPRKIGAAAATVGFSALSVVLQSNTRCSLVCTALEILHAELKCPVLQAEMYRKKPVRRPLWVGCTDSGTHPWGEYFKAWSFAASVHSSLLEPWNKQIESVFETATVAWPSKRACRRKPRLRSVHNNSAPPERRPSAVAQPVCRKTLWPATASTDGLCGCLAFGKH